MDGIKLHPKYGVNPTLVQYQCPATGKIWESGELALLGFNKNKEADKHTIMGLQFCSEVQEKLDQGYVCLVGVDEEKTTDITCPWRTGDVIYVKRSVAERITNIEIKTMAYVCRDVITILKEKMKDAELNAETTDTDLRGDNISTTDNDSSGHRSRTGEMGDANT